MSQVRVNTAVAFTDGGEVQWNDKFLDIGARIAESAEIAFQRSGRDDIDWTIITLTIRNLTSGS